MFAIVGKMKENGEKHGYLAQMDSTQSLQGWCAERTCKNLGSNGALRLAVFEWQISADLETFYTNAHEITIATIPYQPISKPLQSSIIDQGENPKRS
jgi:hypothetical protein